MQFVIPKHSSDADFASVLRYFLPPSRQWLIEDAAMLAEMLSLPNDGRYPALEPIPEQRRQKTLEALGVQLETLARASPVLMVLEDAHWADPTSLEAFDRTVDLVRTLRVLLVVTFRPEFDAPWVGQPHVTALTINRLAERDIGSIIDRIIGQRTSGKTLSSVPTASPCSSRS